MPRVRRPRGARGGLKGEAPRLTVERELVFVARRDAGLRVRREAVTSAPGVDAKSLEKVLSKHGATARPLFGLTETRALHRADRLASAGVVGVPDISVYYRVDAPDERLDDVAAELRRLDVVETAYVKPPAEPAVLNDMAPAAEDAPPVTADFAPRQAYLEAAPGGVDARFAWTVAGGRGTDVRIIDIEGAWRFSHEDLTQNQGGVVGGTPSSDLGWRNHGTGVIGEFGGDVNGFGVTGICPEANVSAISIFGGTGSAGAIRAAADRLRPGDIILIELHRAGPRHGFTPRDDQRGYIAIEWWPDDFDAIRYATTRGVVVVEAAGNGAENLDDAIYNNPQAGFPAGWSNPFNRANRDCGAIVVGVGAPPPGTHGRDHGPDRSRLDFSNYGACIDAQGWGREVTTCGYGDLQGGTNEDLWYTDRFSGTSSASPIVVGAAGCVQGHLRARGASPLTPARMRECLRNTGSAQQDAPTRPATQRIGNRPNLRDLVACAVGKNALKDRKDTIKETKEVKEKDLKDAKDRVKERKDLVKDTKELNKDLKDRVKERKDVKEFKEKEKDIFEGGGGAFGTAPAESDLAARVAQLEDVVAQLTHFIGPELRPDLSTGALGNERDLGGGGGLDKESADAKLTKDTKDAEKVRDA